MTPFERLCERAQREVDERLPACQLAVARHGELLGFRTFSRTGDETDTTRFLLWSCTKGVVAGVVWQLIGEGLLDPEERVEHYLPGFGTNGKDVITVEQLLLHTAGIPLAPLGPQYWGTSEGRRTAFARWRLNWEPGTRFEYHALSAGWVLAELILEVSGEDHRAAVRRRIAEPLGLATLELGVPEAAQVDLASLSAVGTRATEEEHRQAGVFHAGSPARGDAGPPAVEVSPALLLGLDAPAAREVGIPSGGAFATAADVALYYQALLRNPDELWPPAVLADGTGVIRNTFPDRPKWGMPANRSRGVVVRGDHGLAHWMMHFGRARRRGRSATTAPGGRSRGPIPRRGCRSAS